MHERIKHIHINFHFLKEIIIDNVINSEHCGTNNHSCLTKPLTLELYLMKKLIGHEVN